MSRESWRRIHVRAASVTIDDLILIPNMLVPKRIADVATGGHETTIWWMNDCGEGSHPMIFWNVDLVEILEPEQ